MAEIPVERKTGGGLPWWLIPLLLLLLLIPLLFFLSRGCNDAAVVGNTNGNANANRAVTGTTNTANTTANGTAVVTNANMGGNMTTGASNANMGGNMSGNTGGGAAVTDVNLFGGTTDKSSLVGRSVNFSNVKVNRVLSDHVFTVTSGSGEMFAYLDEGLDTGGGKEQQIKIRPGQNLNITGDFRRVPTEEVKEEAQKGAKNTGLTPAEYGQMKGQQIYLHTNRVSDAK